MHYQHIVSGHPDSRAGDEQSKPLGPVSTQLEIVVIVAQPNRLQLIEQIVQGATMNGSDHDDILLYPKFVRCQPEACVDGSSRQAAPLICLSTDAEAWTLTRDRKRHLISSGLN